MAEQPAHSETEALSLVRAALIQRACPWCGEVAWDAGVVAATSLTDGQGSFHIDRAVPRRSRISALFTCTACTYTVMFYLAEIVVPPPE
jgi:predicted nucleic-acid-binding Zn-ribbon protein